MEMTEQTTDIVRTNASSAFSDTALASIDSYDAAALMLDEQGIPAETMADYGTGFLVVEKETLLSVPFLILQWRFNPGKYANEFVSVEAVTKTNDKVIFNDGSDQSGICAQLRMVTSQRLDKKHPTPQAGLIVEGGLTKTGYFYNSVTKETSSKAREGKDWGPASTFYLAS